MKIRYLRFNGFRKFEEQRLIFGETVTVISGINGVGKSTILGIVANSAQYTDKILGDDSVRPQAPYSLLNKRYRAEFSDLFSASEDYNSNTQHVFLGYTEDGEEKELGFRTTFQTSNLKSKSKSKGTKKRFRLIPYKHDVDGKQSEAKLKSPVIYLGLSRLYPSGETSAENKVKALKLTEEEQKWFAESFSRVLSLSDDIKEVNSVANISVKSKFGTGIETDEYGALDNSSGQDNLGQILLAMLSFERLESLFGEAWDGAQLVIDEFDATLHPAAQNRLFDLVHRHAKQHKYQVVFTTHSISLLEYLSKKTEYNRECGNDIEHIYLTTGNSRHNVDVLRNLGGDALHEKLLVLPHEHYRDLRQVPVIVEDDEAKWFLDGLIRHFQKDIYAQIKIISTQIGCDSLLQLVKNDTEYCSQRVVVLDGDVSTEKVTNRLSSVPPNLVILPGGDAPEKLIYEFLCSQRENIDPGFNEALNGNGVELIQFTDNGPDTFDGLKPREQNKQWFIYNRYDFDKLNVLEFWIKNNQEIASEFVKSFCDAYKFIARKTTGQIR